MKYVLLAYEDQQQLDIMSSKEREALENACLDNNMALQKRGQLLVLEGLQRNRTATTIRVQHSHLSVTPGPVAETKEQLVGVFTITARDLNEAIQIAANMPQARSGPIEVRPLVAFDQQ